jgi:hypothetical protein
MKIPTASELFDKYAYLSYLNYDDGCSVSKDAFEKALLEFAKLHVEAALKAASENVVVDYTHVEPDNIEVYAINSSILNAYPLKNII